MIAETLARVLELVAGSVCQKTVKPDVSLEDMGLDSLDRFELAMDLSEAFGLDDDLDTEDFPQCGMSCNDIAAHIERLLKNKSRRKKAV